MATDPVLRDWRIINGCLLGQVRDHPLIEDGWMITSEITARGDDWARTQTRRYCLEAPWPEHEPMPAAAAAPIANRILGNVGPLPSLEAAVQVVAAAERVALEIIRRGRTATDAEITEILRRLLGGLR